MNELELLVELHGGGERQGPGSRAATLRAAEMAGLPGRSGLRIADLGCGTGSASLLLGQVLDGDMLAVDLVPAFLQTLQSKADSAVLRARLSTSCASIDALPFEPGSLDVIWSEGAIYNLGFAAGIRAWRPYLRPGGILAVSELTWLTARRPAEIDAHWQAQYPEVDTAAGKIAVLEAGGYRPLGYFPLPADCWVDNFYRPLRERSTAFLARHGDDPKARAVVDAELREADLYDRYGGYYGYGFYIAERLPGDG